MKLEFSTHIIKKYPNIKFHENLSSGSRVVPCGWTEMTKLIVAFRHFANVPINAEISLRYAYIKIIGVASCWYSQLATIYILTSMCTELTFFKPSRKQFKERYQKLFAINLSN